MGGNAAGSGDRARAARPLKIGVIIDGFELRRWQREALDQVAGSCDFFIYSCTNPHRQKKRLRHALYYALNIWAIRNRSTQRVTVADHWSVIATREFQSVRQGTWEELPASLLQQIGEDQPAVLIKFGMGLLRVPPPDQLSVPILSYHHGEPRKFRGRPAGFYELLQGEPSVGQVVQVLSNSLDGGGIVAQAETRIVPHSYRATLVEAFRRSPLLLRPAIANCIKGRIDQPASLGRNYRLPKNAQVAQFVLKLMGKAVRRAIYGAFFEKRWKVATLNLVEQHPTIEAIATDLVDPGKWQILAIPHGYSFLADPFVHPSGGLLVEAMNKRTGHGDILHIEGAHCRRISSKRAHHSYPATVEVSGCAYMVPEITNWSEPVAFPLFASTGGRQVALDIPRSPKLVDPTPLVYQSAVYLFASVLQEGNSVLRLWVADDLSGPFAEHPSSPIRISPKGARMAGQPFLLGDRLIRVGQNLTGKYGDGICLFRIERLDRECYSEKLIKELKFTHCQGPHTLNIAAETVVFDFYHEKFSLFSGIRRIQQRMPLRGRQSD